MWRVGERSRDSSEVASTSAGCPRRLGASSRIQADEGISVTEATAPRRVRGDPSHGQTFQRVKDVAPEDALRQGLGLLLRTG